MATQSKVELFLELAKPDENGVSRWVSVTEFTGKYESLRLGNGLDFGRRETSFAKKYIIELDKKVTPGPSIDRIRLNGYNRQDSFSQYISPEIAKVIRQKKCVMLGVNGQSANTRIEVDHKDGRKNDMRVANPATQKESDFQPLCKAANDIKRQICKECKLTNRRWDAKNIAGNPYSFYEGNENYTEELGCVGCYQYDPVEYRKRSVRKICLEASQHTAEYICKKIYGE